MEEVEAGLVATDVSIVVVTQLVAHHRLKISEEA